MNNSKLKIKNSKLPFTLCKNEAYYLLKKLVPRQLQLSIRRHIIQRQLSRYSDVWPIDKNATKPPEGWTGWPEGKKFALVITHDVESAKGLINCRQLAELDKRCGFRSSFNFVAEDYEVSTELRHYLTDNGFEIGIHGLQHDKNPFRSEKIFKKQAVKINRYLKEWDVAGFRAPSMYHNLDMIHYLNVEYDASTFDTDPFEPQPNGMETIFPFWVPSNSKQKGYVELPYTLPQDFLIFVLLKEKTIDVWKKKLDWIVENGGMALFITHPDYMNFNGSKDGYGEYNVRLYEEFLSYIKEKYNDQYWNVLPHEISHFWKNNYKFTLSAAGESEIMEKRKYINTLMLTESYFPSDIRVKREAFKLIDNGYGVSAIVVRNHGQPFFEVINGVKVYRIPRIELFKYGKQSKSKKLPLLGKLSLLIKAVLGYGFEYFYFTFSCCLMSIFVFFKDRFHVIHTHNPPDTLFVIPLIYKFLGVQFVYDHHDLCPELFLEKYGSGNKTIYKILLFLERVSCKLADRIIATNESYKKIEIERCGVNLEDVYVVRYGPDLTEMKIDKPIEEIISQRKTVLCYLGAINIQDGVDYLLDMLSHVVYKHNRKDVILLVIGDGDYLKNIKIMAKELELMDHIIFTGYIYDRQLLNRYLSTADIFVDAAPYSFLNNSSTFIKHMEYMIYQKPVVSFALKESMYSLRDAGIFIPPNDTEKMADAIVELMKNEQLKKTLGNNAIERIKQLTWEKVSSPLIHAYESLKQN